VRRQIKVLRRARYPLRESRYANHLYIDHQHVVMLALRQHFRKSYRDFCEMLDVCTSILDELGLRRVPHWTTLHKFSKRTNTRTLERLLLAFLEEARVRVSIWRSIRPGSARHPRARTTPAFSSSEKARWEDTGEES
jgi:hypothetical protein